MMKRILALAAIVMIAGTAAAQRVQFGVRAGVFSQDMELTAADLNGANLITDARMGFHVALVSRVRLMDIGTGAAEMGLFLQPEIVFSQNRYRMQLAGDNPITRIRMQSVDIPVLLSFKLSLFRIHAGPVVNAIYKTNTIRESGGLTSLKPSVGYAIGGSVDIFSGLVLDARFYGQLKKLTNSIQTGGETFNSVRGSLSSWSVGLSWLF